MSGGGRVSAAFDAFLASVDPVAIERERFGIPDRSERPGSPEDLGMRAEHDERVEQFHRQLAFPHASPSEIRQLIKDMSEYESSLRARATRREVARLSIEHGTKATYDRHKCRCARCTAANTRYMREYRAHNKETA